MKKNKRLLGRSISNDRCLKNKLNQFFCLNILYRIMLLQYQDLGIVKE